MARKDAARRSAAPAEVSPQQLEKEKQEGGAAQQQASGEKGGPSLGLAAMPPPLAMQAIPSSGLALPSRSIPA